MKMYLKFGLWSLFFCYGCGMVKRNKEKNVSASSEQATVKFEQKEQNQSKVDWQRNLLNRDSAGIEFLVEILPSGPFNYSPYKGFEGTAQKIIYFGKASNVSSSLLNEQVKADQKGSSQSRFQEKKAVKQSSKRTGKAVERTYSWKWILALLLLLVGISTYIFKNYGNIGKRNFWTRKE
ncbi:hypothetical protein LPB86_20120 [Pedobacter sp. MC2016-14]|uniref:hypothetical protein n=1 Tax=Pedobacter sp. MC2016-14 TaxID=2897327 RepID=UPI001E3E3CE0|nr:hypothetical protein [Pedobacter sp. MC2016-14]MCD0490557.1 hypothetical protein [Pedobacter sp. MC2016-14]